MGLFDRLRDWIDDIGDKIGGLFGGGGEREPPDEPPDDDDWDYEPEDFDGGDEPPPDEDRRLDPPYERILIRGEPEDSSEFDRKDIRGESKMWLDWQDAVEYAKDIPVPTIVVQTEDGEWIVVIDY